MFLTKPLFIIEDDLDDVFFYERALQKMDYKGSVQFFSSSVEALAELRRAEPKPFLILSDINMPVINGFELKQQLNHDDTLRNLPIIFVTTSMNPSDVLKAKDLGVNGFFEKNDVLDPRQIKLRSILEYWELCLFHSM